MVYTAVVCCDIASHVNEDAIRIPVSPFGMCFINPVAHLGKSVCAMTRMPAR